MNERAGARVWLARTLVWQGEWLLGRDERDGALASFDRARDIAGAIGSVQVGALIDRVLARAKRAPSR